MNKRFALAAMLFLISCNAFSIERNGDESGFYLVINYRFESRIASRADLGFGFGFKAEQGFDQHYNALETNGTDFSCVDCTDEEFTRATVIYGLILLVGYGIAK